MRKNYIDNLRWLAVLLLFPYHTAMIYNDFGENFYIRGPSIPVVSAFVISTYTWFMPLLFVLAGISTSYALQKRSPKEFVRERYEKLLTPLASGILLMIPVQTYFAERFHNGYTGGYFQQYILYFTKKTDLTGYTGGFTPAHLWFLFYLFVISLISLPIILWYKRSGRKFNGSRMTIPVLLPLFLFPLVMAPVLDIGGKSIGEDFALFLLGYFVLSDDEVTDRLEKRRWPLLAAAVILDAAGMVWHFTGFIAPGILGDCFERLVMWMCVLAFLGMGKRYFNFRTKATAYLASASFPIYVFHQTILVAVAYFVFQFSSIPAVQIALILPITVCLTFLIYEVFRRIPVTRVLFRIRAPKKPTQKNTLQDIS